jgi:S1-C subfamily serine protease
MGRNQKLIIVLVVVLFLACSAIACLTGLVFGAAWAGRFGRWDVRSPTPFERDFGPRMPMEPRQGPNEGTSAALVTEVTEGGPADEAGLQEGDLILAIDGERIQAGTNLREMISLYRPGDQVELTIRRGSRTRQVRVVLGRRADDPTQPHLGLTIRLIPMIPQ